MKKAVNSRKGVNSLCRFKWNLVLLRVLASGELMFQRHVFVVLG